jgi:hypothetical protein
MDFAELNRLSKLITQLSTFQAALGELGAARARELSNTFNIDEDPDYNSIYDSLVLLYANPQLKAAILDETGGRDFIKDLLHYCVGPAEKQWFIDRWKQNYAPAVEAVNAALRTTQAQLDRILL